jgi:hypothetical protein
MVFVSPCGPGTPAVALWVVVHGLWPVALYVCFTICLCISPDLDGMFVCLFPGTEARLRFKGSTMMICFTICSFISPDLDGQRAPKTRHGMFKAF